MIKNFWIQILCIGTFLMCPVAFSQDEDAAPSQESSAEEAPSSAPQDSETQKSNVKPTSRKGRAPREKEAEGTQAPHRFDTHIPKSKYELNGQPLEVDPD